MTIASGSRLVQLFTLLIYCMASGDEKRLLLTATTTSITASQNSQTALDHFWSKFFFPHVCNAHTAANLNKQVATHFLYQALLGSPQTLDYILATAGEQSADAIISSSSSSSSSSTAGAGTVFTHRIARELPMVTVVVDHEDGELVAYNKQCLHAYYATLRIMCEHSRAFTRAMCTHANFAWAFKHIYPFYGLYAQAVQELNRCVLLFVNEEGPGTTAAATATRKRPRRKSRPARSSRSGDASTSNNHNSENLRLTERGFSCLVFFIMRHIKK
jgi:nitrite reductase/ring-hydroxylating ferredoxin subunit